MNTEILNLYSTYPDLSQKFHLGIEKEGLRVNPLAVLSQEHHPLAFGSKLTHPSITTDYSEALLEFITPAFTSIESTLSDLKNIHAFCSQRNPGEYIWPMSMPSILPDEDDQIPVAHYGSSNVGRLKELYRIGLGHRYGRSMQSIAGLHYNFSLDDNFLQKAHESLHPGKNFLEFRDQLYFKIIRNYRRYNWLLSYLFGASPCVDESFLKNKKHKLEKIGPNTYGLKYATALRMGGLGYTSLAQESISICYNGLKTYIRTLEEARLTSYKEYEKIGIKKDNEYLQLNTNLIQIDNEFYSTIRPKHPAKSGQSALGALHEGGVEYIELRVMDLDPFEPVGISENTSKFLHLFVLTCLAMEDKQIDGVECDRIKSNFLKVVTSGRDPSLKLETSHGQIPLKEVGMKFFESLDKVIKVLDPKNEKGYKAIYDNEMEKIIDPTKTLSHKVYELSSKEGHINLGKRLAKEHFDKLVALKLDDEYVSQMEANAKNSLDEQLLIERNDEEDFEIFLSNYFDQIKIHWN